MKTDLLTSEDYIHTKIVETVAQIEILKKTVEELKEISDGRYVRMSTRFFNAAIDILIDACKYLGLAIENKEI